MTKRALGGRRKHKKAMEELLRKTVQRRIVIKNNTNREILTFEPELDITQSYTTQEMEVALKKIKPLKAPVKIFVIEMITALDKTETEIMLTIWNQIWHSCNCQKDG